MRDLTVRQSIMLDLIIDYIGSFGYPPTLREIGKHMNILSTNGVNDHLRSLERKGYIRRSFGYISRGIEILRCPEGPRLKVMLLTDKDIAMLNAAREAVRDE
jgi:repressor LexA